MRRLAAGDVACWVLKTNVPPVDVVPGWRPGTSHDLVRCVRPSYRLGLMSTGAPVLLWLSGRHEPGVHAVGIVAGPVIPDAAGPVVPVRLTRLGEPVGRAELLADPVAREAEVLRMPAGSNPSWLSRSQFDAVRARVGAREGAAGLGPWSP